ncbi:peptide deformylase [Paucihalobacter ruber]|uniref:Peptide deformylase n=1 Tax=Paucihalobacter ruber TaxID=2567861 RepID=A0A506PJK8_9FLAO|nr:peptide deformylase [Paucihalobacter ruber]TPV33993.1 peptide deformylase [Paucihalobacter ruber]
MKQIFRFGLYLFIVSIVSSCAVKKQNIKEATSNFNQQQRSMILNADGDKPMRVFKINNVKDSLLLRQKSEDVVITKGDTILKHFTNRLYATVRDSISLGVGIAAPQVGILKNIIWVQRFDKEEFPFEVYLNPKIVQYSQKKQTRAEGCLSIPNRRETLNCRAYAILLEYDTLDGEHKTEMVEDFTAIIFQHEVDHLNGVLYIDLMDKF